MGSLIPRLLGGVLLGTALGCLILCALTWAALDPCGTEPAVPVMMVATVLSLGATGVTTVVHMFELRATPVWAAAVAVWSLSALLWLLLLNQAATGALDCTWRIHPAVPEQVYPLPSGANGG
ncbi:MAG: hypothetical protein EXR69_12830 [Myxococcales bacterium]|nr:hypothetical protein [Myxococcales bacterium]